MLLRKALLVFLPCTLYAQVQLNDHQFCPTLNVAATRAALLANNNVQAQLLGITNGGQKFGLELLAKISDVAYDVDFMISPFSVWALLLLLIEASGEGNQQELRSVLHVNAELPTLRRAFNVVQQFLQIKTATVEVANLQAMFVDTFEYVSSDYKRILETCYSAKVQNLHFNDTQRTVNFINNVIRTQTKGLIEKAVTAGDVQDANLLLTSTLYFKGQWKFPFDKNNTRREPFYNMYGEPIGEVDMMFQMAPFNYTSMTNLSGHVLELPYGNENRLCMLVVLPNKGISLNQLIHNLEKIGMEAIFHKLAADSVGFDGDEVEVYLPRFTTTTTIPLRGTLEQLGLLQMFDPQRVDFSKLSNRLYVKDVVHSTKIIVNEEGTEAAAVATAILANKISPPKFYLNRPFLYLIVEKYSNSLLLAGQVTSPK